MEIIIEGKKSLMAMVIKGKKMIMVVGIALVS